MDDLPYRLRHGYGASPRKLMMEAADAIERLERWKAEAVAALDEWERVWEAAGRPGRLGESKAAAVQALADANLLAASSPAVTAAERDVIDAAVAHVAYYSPSALNDSFRELLAAVDRLAAARNDTDKANQ